MDCPACQAALVVVERERIELDWCVDCRGLWFDEGELELLGEKAGRSLETEDLGRRPGDTVATGTRRCPRCRRKMEQLSLDIGKGGGKGGGEGGDVQIDRCPDHGFWLDRGELGAIMRRHRTGRGSDEGLMLSFLGETFDAVHAEASREGRNS
jgi:Zn-finger nucleic acid-binding protein